MKNIKNIVAALTLTAALGFGATAANAGMLISDKTTTPSPCSASKGKSGLLKRGLFGIGKLGFLLSDGILMSDGMLMSDGLMLSDDTCTDGILMSDGLMVSDGILISD